MKDYHINIFYSDEDEGYIADIPDLHHCSAFGAGKQKTSPEAPLSPGDLPSGPGVRGADIFMRSNSDI